MGSNLEKVISLINKTHGEGTVCRGSNTNLKIERVRSGITALDLVIGGGIPRSAIIEFYGRESGGKTTTALKTVASYQKQGLTCAFIDMEHSLDPEWATSLGVDMESLIISQPDTAEKSVDIVDLLTRSNEVDLIVYDSLAAAVPKEEQDKSAFDQQMALQARLFSKMCRKLMSALQPENLEDQSSYNRTTIICINQVREKVGQMYARGYETPGGHAVKHTAKMIVEFKRGDYLKVSGQEDPVGIEVKFKTVKNKTWVPYKIGLYRLYNDGNVDNDETIVIEAKKHGIIQQKGSMYEYEDIKERGITDLIRVLHEQNLFEQLTNRIYEVINKGGKKDESGRS